MNILGAINANNMAAMVQQETIDPSEPVPVVESLRTPARRSSPFSFAAVGTVVFAVFFVALAWGLGHLTGESLFHTVEEAAS